MRVRGSSCRSVTPAAQSRRPSGKCIDRTGGRSLIHDIVPLLAFEPSASWCAPSDVLAESGPPKSNLDSSELAVRSGLHHHVDVPRLPHHRCRAFIHVEGHGGPADEHHRESDDLEFDSSSLQPRQDVGTTHDARRSAIRTRVHAPSREGSARSRSSSWLARWRSRARPTRKASTSARAAWSLASPAAATGTVGCSDAAGSRTLRAHQRRWAAHRARRTRGVQRAAEPNVRLRRPMPRHRARRGRRRGCRGWRIA